MITMQELNPHNYPVSADKQRNLDILLERINKLRLLWAKPMYVTSGLRTLEDQMRINPKAPHSKHVIGAAVDISDAHGALMQWLLSDPSLLSQVELWCEADTHGWVHFQCIPPLSNKRFFLP
jgi:hypothetical protein